MKPYEDSQIVVPGGLALARHTQFSSVKVLRTVLLAARQQAALRSQSQGLGFKGLEDGGADRLTCKRKGIENALWRKLQVNK